MTSTHFLYRATLVAAALGVLTSGSSSSSSTPRGVHTFAALAASLNEGGNKKASYQKPRHEWKSNVPPTVPMDKQSLKRRWRDKLMQKSGAKKRLMQRRASGAAEAARAAALAAARRSRSSSGSSLIRKRPQQEDDEAMAANNAAAASSDGTKEDVVAGATVNDDGPSSSDDQAEEVAASSVEADDVPPSGDEAVEEAEPVEEDGGSMTVVGGRGRRHEGTRSGVNSHTQHVHHGPADGDDVRTDL
jgi:hypothetical protein